MPDQPFLPSCPDKNKVYFKPTGSVFCQFSLVKPFIPKAWSPGNGTNLKILPSFIVLWQNKLMVLPRPVEKSALILGN
uniref:Uncharacterized protein n=1 Tax=Laticauda laticaudata TaxID=8630 RepID=A0A8C5SJN7_LATLA